MRLISDDAIVPHEYSQCFPADYCIGGQDGGEVSGLRSILQFIYPLTTLIPGDILGFYRSSHRLPEVVDSVCGILIGNHRSAGVDADPGKTGIYEVLMKLTADPTIRT